MTLRISPAVSLAFVLVVAASTQAYATTDLITTDGQVLGSSGSDDGSDSTATDPANATPPEEGAIFAASGTSSSNRLDASVSGGNTVIGGAGGWGMHANYPNGGASANALSTNGHDYLTFTVDAGGTIYSLDGGDGFNAGAAATPGGTGGNGGVAVLVTGTDWFTLSNHGSIWGSGAGIGGSGGTIGNQNGGNAGDVASAIRINSDSSHVLVHNYLGSQIAAVTSGSDGGAAGNNGNGGRGSKGGDGIVIFANGTSIINDDTIEAAQGGNGGAAGGTGNGGNGGRGGHGIDVEANNVTISNNVLNDAYIAGGNSGIGGTSAGGAGGDSGNGGAGIYVAGTGIAITNSGTIRGGDASFGANGVTDGADGTAGGGVVITSSATGGTITNSGEITSGTFEGSSGAGKSIDLRANTTLINNSGTIGDLGGGASGWGVYLSDNVTLSTLTNSGTIATTGSGISLYLGTDSLITAFDNDNGAIIAENMAIFNNGVFGSFTNAGGTISATANGGVAIYQNTGLSPSAFDNSNGLITVSGTNGRALVNGGSYISEIINAGGTISATGDTGIAIDNLSISIDLIDNDGGTITTTDDNAVTINGNSATLTTLTNNGGTITSLGDNSTTINNVGVTITLLDNTNGVISAAGSTSIALNNDGGSSIATLRNINGTIESTGDHFALNNDGTITSLNNTNGTIAANTGSALYNTGTVTTVLNSGGTISTAGEYGVYVGGGGQIGTLDNRNGTISSDDVNSISIDNEGTITSLLNTGGLIDGGADGHGFWNKGTGLVTTFNNRDGTIQTAGNGTYPIQNDGTITLFDNTDGTIGLLSGDGTQVFYNNGPIAQLINVDGTISASNGDNNTAFYNDGGGAITLFDNRNGTIEATGFAGLGLSNSGTITTLNNDGGNIVGNNGAIDNLLTIGLLSNVGGEIIGQDDVAANGGVSIYNRNTATITTLDNTNGTITGYSSGVYNEGTLTTLNNTDGTINTGTGSGSSAVFNSGTITTLLNMGGLITKNVATQSALENANAGTITTLDNSDGEIIADAADGVGLRNDGTITSLSNIGGLIRAAGNGGMALYTSNTLTVIDNTDGTISGDSGGLVNDLTIGTIINDGGTISATGAGGDAIANGGPSTITLLNNSNGTITSIGGNGIYTNGAIGTINNTNGLIESGGGSNTYGTVHVLGGGSAITTLDNTDGTISNTGDGGVAVWIEGGAVLTALNNVGGTIKSTGDSAYVFLNTSTITTLNNDAGSIITTGGNSITLRNTGTLTTLSNVNGVIEGKADNTSVLMNSGTITTLNNTGGRIRATVSGSVAIDNSSTITTLNNTNGVISSINLPAMFATGSGSITSLNNAGGLITSAAPSTIQGTLYIGSDFGNMAVTGGTISNTYTGSNTASVFYIDSNQSGLFDFQGVNIASDGSGGTHSGAGISFSLQGDTSLSFDEDTTVYGRIISVTGSILDLITSGTIVGDIALNDQDDVLTIYDGSITGDIDMGTGTNTLNIAGSFTSGGTISADDPLTGGAINVDIGPAGAFTLDHNMAVSLGDLTIEPGGSLTLREGNITVDGAGTLVNGGSLLINDGRVLTIDEQTADAAGGNFTFQIGSSASAGQIILNSDSVDLTGADVHVDLSALSSYIADGTFFNVIDGNGGIAATVAAGPVASGNTLMYQFDYVRGDDPDVGASDKDIYLIANRTPLTALASNDSTLEIGGILDVLGGLNDPIFQQIQGNLGAATTTQQIDDLLTSLRPTVDGSALLAPLSIGGLVSNLTSSRLTALRADPAAGIATGNASLSGRLWMQPYLHKAHQGALDSVGGYNVKTMGVAIGGDTECFTDCGIVGVSLNYARTNAHSDNLNTTDTSINSYGINLYRNLYLSEDTFVDLQGGYTYNHISSIRHNVGGPGITAFGKTHSSQYSVRTALGHDYSFPAQCVTITPAASAAYTYIDTAGYSETGAGLGGLILEDNHLQVLDLGGDMTFDWRLRDEDGNRLNPALHLGYTYDVLADNIQSTATFTGGGPSFVTTGPDPAHGKFNIGGKITLTDIDAWSLTGSYDAELKSAYLSHNGSLRVTAPF